MSQASFDIAFPLLVYCELFCNPQGHDPCVFDVFRYSIVRGNYHTWSISLMVDLSNTAEFRYEWDDLWFPLSIISSKSDFRVSSSIGSRWQRDAYLVMLIILALSL